MEQNNISPKNFRIGNLLENFLGETFEVNIGTLNLLSGYISNEFPLPKPITLTEEWLLKFGFTKDKNLFFHPDHSYIEKDAYNCNGGFGYCLHDERGIYKEIKYVHTLQNFCFAMADKELTIK